MEEIAEFLRDPLMLNRLKKESPPADIDFFGPSVVTIS
jgi:hypothetical protein